MALSVLIVLAVLIVAAYVWYHHTGWTSFDFSATPFSYGPPCLGCNSKSSLACTAGSPCCTQMSDGSCLQVTPCSVDTDCAPPYASCTGGICVPALPPSWTAGGNRTVDRLRFKDCVFEVAGAGSKDVTGILNGMAAAYKGAPTVPPGVLRLDRPLNPYSFHMPSIAGYSAADAAALAGNATTLKGKVRTI